jgi:hypothetical protein
MVLRDLTRISDATSWMASRLCYRNRFLGAFASPAWSDGSVFVFTEPDVDWDAIYRARIEGNVRPLRLDDMLPGSLDFNDDSKDERSDSVDATRRFIRSFLGLSHRTAAIFVCNELYTPSWSAKLGVQAFTVGPTRTEFPSAAVRNCVHNFLFVTAARASSARIKLSLFHATDFPKVCLLVLLPADLVPLEHGLTLTGVEFEKLITSVRYVIFNAFDYTSCLVWCAAGVQPPRSF